MCLYLGGSLSENGLAAQVAFGRDLPCKDIKYYARCLLDDVAFRPALLYSDIKLLGLSYPF